MEREIFKLLQTKFAAEEIEFAAHAVQRMIQRTITILDVKTAIANGQLIEDYPNDTYGPSCLIFGKDQKNRPLHIVCSYPQRIPIKVISVYEPDLAKWEADLTRRRK